MNPLLLPWQPGVGCPARPGHRDHCSTRPAAAAGRGCRKQRRDNYWTATELPAHGRITVTEPGTGNVTRNPTGAPFRPLESAGLSPQRPPDLHRIRL